MTILDLDALLRFYRDVRRHTEALVEPLSAEDMQIQSMPDASPAKWHLAHTTWFFEEFVLARFDPAHRWSDPGRRVLFNSYYDAVGPRHARPQRGLLSRPGLAEVFAWRRAVDEAMVASFPSFTPAVAEVARLGIHHEQQHQELVLSDVKHALSCHPFKPAYRASGSSARAHASTDTVPRDGHTASSAAPEWCRFDERIAEIGHRGEGFAFDNEGPPHRALVGDFSLATRPVTHTEYARFIADGGYERPELWLSDGWAMVQSAGWGAPLYWATRGGERAVFTLDGVVPMEDDAPVGHLSFYEADAYARWAGARLPTEQEWEVAAAHLPVEGNFVESGLLSPASSRGTTHARPDQLFGDVWEWTSSAYLPYPRYRPLSGALGEYNGKFMSGQMVLRGGSCWSPRSHLRATYRNFFPPSARWQMTGVRLAKD